MNAKSISNPKIAIVASLLMGGVLTIAAVELRPDNSELSSDQPNVESRSTRAPASQDQPPPPSAVASGSVATGVESFAAMSQVLDAVRFCLDRNDLESAKVLLQAELVLHKDDPRVLALQHEVQVREAKVGHAPPVALADNAPPVPLPPWMATQPASRPEHSHYAESSPKEHAASPARNARTRYAAAQTTVAMKPVQKAEAPRPLTASVETGASPATPASPVPMPTAAAVAPLMESLPVHQAPPVAQAESIVQPAPPAQSAQPAAQPETTVAQTSQGPKTRAEVRMELERARSDGDLPRFGNPDPAGPGGAMSMTVNPGAVSH